MKIKIIYVLLSLLLFLNMSLVVGEDNIIYNHNIEIYGSPTCHTCHETKEFLESENMSYKFYNIENSTNLNKVVEYYKRAGINNPEIKIPIVIIDNKWMIDGGINIHKTRYIKHNVDLSNNPNFMKLTSEITKNNNNTNKTNNFKAHIVFVFGTPSCHVCHESKEYLTLANVSNEFYNTEDPENMKKLLNYYYAASIGNRGISIPTIIVDNKWLIPNGISESDATYIKNHEELPVGGRIKLINQSLLNNSIVGKISNLSTNISNTNNMNNINNTKNNVNTTNVAENSQNSNLPYIFMMTGLGELINPCSWAVYIYFISMVLSQVSNKKDLLKYGLSFILSAYLFYCLLAFGIISFSMNINIDLVYGLLSIIAIIFGLIKIYEGVFNKKIMAVNKEHVKYIPKEAGYLGSLVGGAVYALILSPCVIPGYVVASSLMSVVEHTWLWVLLYNFIILIPAMIITGLALFGVELIHIKEFREKNKNKFKIIIGLILLFVGILLWAIYIK